MIRAAIQIGLLHMAVAMTLVPLGLSVSRLSFFSADPEVLENLD